MKQIIQNYRTGELRVVDVSIPLCTPNVIMVKNRASLISLGTERSIIELGKKSIIGKARARPDLVKRFLDKTKKEGFVKTFKEAVERLDEPTALGYSSAGIIIETGKNIHKFSPGDRVACIGAGYASHADYITVPEHLCNKIPDNLTFEEASFGMVGTIALHGIRCANINFGESVAVIGLGLLGLLIVQILKAYGCRVIGTDTDPPKVKFACKLGIDYAFDSIDDFKNGAEKGTNGFGVDAVIVTAATKSDAPVNTAVDIARNRGTVVIVGDTDIHPERNKMWHKEVNIIVSKAGGPGIFDPIYENKGIDYPIGYVRWTENRNLEEFLRLVHTKKVNVKSLISHKFGIDLAENVYKDMLEKKGELFIGVVLEYPEHEKGIFKRSITIKNTEIKVHHKTSTDDKITLGIVGAGLFGKALLLPALKKVARSESVRLHTISTSSSQNAYHTGKKYQFENFNTDYKEIINNQEINTVTILTPHSLHAGMINDALNAGKNVFVEKPLCVNEEELKQIIKTYTLLCNQFSPVLCVGYNRRFSPHAKKAKAYLNKRQNPLLINYRINAGFVSAEHWVHSEEEGGSRIIGEVCHFVDMMLFLTDSEPIRVHAERLSGDNRTVINDDNVAIVIKFADGSVGNIIYTGSGDKAFSRENVEIFFDGKVIVLENYKETLIFKSGKMKKFKTINQKWGYKEELIHFFKLIKSEISCNLSTREIFSSTLTTFKINESLITGKPINIILKNI